MKAKKSYNICTNCVMDTTDPSITFNANGVCSRDLRFYKDILPDWNYGKEKEKGIYILTLKQNFRRKPRGTNRARISQKPSQQKEPEKSP